MIIESARLAANQLFAAEFRHLFWKSIGITLLVLAAAWLVLEALVSTLLAPLLGPWPWLATALVWLTGAGMFVGAIFLIAPVSAALAGVFQDEIAAAVERRHYPADAPGLPLPLLPSIWLSAKFLAVVAAANIVALLLVLLPGINFAVFFVVNAYLIGREYFQFAAMRFGGEQRANALRRANATTIFLAGLVITGFMAVPLLNLATPLFATALMVHLHKRIAARTHGRAPLPRAA
ncbi:MAG: cysteine biosynthesis protein [Alphaproteobacteria bacterium]|nr:MAG: cysteine biosynthesis protein [Alphaproteobacteria bacterium]